MFSKRIHHYITIFVDSDRNNVIQVANGEERWQLEVRPAKM